MTFAHVTVMLEETIAVLAPHAGGLYADATLGGGGHAEAILEASSPSGRVIGIDRDHEALEAARERLSRFGDRATLVHGEMKDVASILRAQRAVPVHGLIADIGVSSPQVDNPERGFSFTKSGPIDMRMDASTGETALDLIERLSEAELADVIYSYGEEHRSRRVARRLKEAVASGELSTTGDLRRAIVRAIGPRRSGVDPATRTFQALRIAVNDELGQLQGFLSEAPTVLAAGGTIAVLTFHSLEDRMVKRAFRDDPRLEVVVKKPLVPSDAEIERNPRSRSAKLRAARLVESEVAA